MTKRILATTIEKKWITKAGFEAVAVLTRGRHRCGYVGVPADHPLYGVAYDSPCEYLTFPEGEKVGKRGILNLLAASCDDAYKTSMAIVFDVHGGVTFSDKFTDNGELRALGVSNLWWIGFDCAHAGDGKITYPEDPSYMLNFPEDVVRSLEYVVEECESLATQIVTRCKVRN